MLLSLAEALVNGALLARSRTGQPLTPGARGIAAAGGAWAGVLGEGAGGQAIGGAGG